MSDGFLNDDSVSPVGNTDFDIIPVASVIEQEVKDVMSRHDAVNSPQHYQRNPEGIEVISITRHLNNNKGNAVKYILRADHKGNAKEDLQKAIWYLNDELDRIYQYGN